MPEPYRLGGEPLPTFEQLLERVEKLEGKGVALQDLPITQLQQRLEQGWQPNPGILLPPGGIGSGLLATAAVVAAALAPGSVTAAAIADGAVQPAHLAAVPQVFASFTGSNIVNHYASGAFTRIPLDTDDFPQTGNGLSLANDNIVIPRAGAWIIAAGALSASLPDTATSGLAIYVNSAEYRRLGMMGQGAANNYGFQGALVGRFAAGATVDARYFQNSGAAKDAVSGATQTYLHATWLSN